MKRKTVQPVEEFDSKLDKAKPRGEGGLTLPGGAGRRCPHSPSGKVAGGASSICGRDRYRPSKKIYRRGLEAEVSGECKGIKNNDENKALFIE